MLQTSRKNVDVPIFKIFLKTGCCISLTEILNHIRDIKDPEHPYTLEELKVVSEEAIDVDDKRSHVRYGDFFGYIF